MVKDVIVIYRIHETILILISSKRYFSYPKNQYLTYVFLTLRKRCNFHNAAATELQIGPS